MINNRKLYQYYLTLRLVLYVIGGLILLLIYVPMLFHSNWSLIKSLVANCGFISIYFLVILLIGIMTFAFYEFIVRPTYVEFQFNEKEVIIRTFTSNIRNWISIFLNFQFNKYVKELKLSKQEYNSYKLQIDKCGFRKLLILQKINKDGIFETTAINISLFDSKKYTNLILAIDRLQVKLNLN